MVAIGSGANRFECRARTVSRMSRTETDAKTGGAAGDVTRRGQGTGEPSTSTAVRYARRAFESGVLAGVGGGITLLGGLRALRRGEFGRAVGRLVVGAGLLLVARRQRRSGGGESGATAPELSGDDAAASPGDDAAANEGTASDAATDAETNERAGVSGTGEISLDRLGAAAFDEHSSELPVPQQAFNLELLVLEGEVFWGVREADDAVVASGLFDPLQDGEGLRYVASSEVDGERTLRVPDAVVDHWNDAVGGEETVTGGDEVVFATSDALRADDQLLVVPEQWAEEAIAWGE